MRDPAAPTRTTRVLALYGTAAAVLVLDQLVKYLVVANLAGRPPLDVIGSFVQLRYTTNSGGAFSLLTGAPLFFGVTAIVIIGGIGYAPPPAHPPPLLVGPARFPWGAGEPDRPAAGGRGPAAGRGRRLHQGRHLAGVQPGRLLHRGRRAAAGHPPRPGRARPGPAPGRPRPPVPPPH